MKEKMSKSERSGHVLIVHEDKFTQIPEVVVEEIEEEETGSIEPGGPGWEYVNLKLADELQVTLATLWENAEEVYIEDFSQVMFMKRIILNAIMPMVSHARNHLNKYINAPDDKQMYLRKFQQLYNEFDADIRGDLEFKAELHCRVNDLREKLIAVCDQQMIDAEQARCLIISRNWAPRQLVELLNNYINGFQLEIDRHVDTLILVSDYYAGIVTKLPIQESLTKEALSRLDLFDPVIEESVNEILLEIDEDLGDPFSNIVEQVYNKALAFSNKCQNWAWSGLEKVKLVFSPHVEKGKDKQMKKGKNMKGEKSQLTIFEPNYDVKKYSDKLFEEWKCVLKGETARLVIRLKLLRYDMVLNLEQSLKTIRNNMSQVFENIRTKYNQEVSTVNRACTFLARAIEAAVPIQEELVFRNGEFSFSQNILFSDVPSPEESTVEISEEMMFNMVQLDNMMDILFDLAPSGYIPERTFVYLLQDMVTEEERNVAPKSWHELTPENVTQFSNELFGHQKLIWWRDFIIYNFMVPFPSAEYILCLRKNYKSLDTESTELINEDQYKSVALWFEEIIGAARSGLIKGLIFKMYKVTEEYFNYTAMLYDFCKDQSASAGIAKAFALSLGKLVCWDYELGNTFVEETLERRRIHEEEVRIRDQERKENQQLADSILLDVMDEVVHQCDSVVIEDLTENTSEHFLQKQEIGGKMTIKNSTEDLPEDEENLTTGSIKDNENATGKYLKPTKDAFSNLEIGFENCDNTSLTYFITLDGLIGILAKTSPTSIGKENLEEESFSDKLLSIFEECRNAKFNNEVLSHDIFNNTKFLDLLSEFFDFQIKNPPKIIAQLIETNKNTSI